MPNLGLYTKPDGPCANWSELLPAGKIAEAQAAQEEAIEYAIKDMVFVASNMIDSGADGINFDTVGASGDADVKAALEAVKILRSKYPSAGFEIGMAGEFNLGMHGGLEFDGETIAGAYPHQQVKMAEKAGASIFGMAVNTDSCKSLAWNLARVVTFAKATTNVAGIPVHANVGMGVGGVPLSIIPSADAVSRVDKALIEIGRVDGLQVGAGDTFGMAVTHESTAGMGGIRSAGDLVFRMELQKMKINEAKKYVAGKLGVSIADLSDCAVMKEVREDLNIGTTQSRPNAAVGIQTKFRIANLLNISINSVNKFRKEAGI